MLHKGTSSLEYPPYLLTWAQVNDQYTAASSMNQELAALAAFLRQGAAQRSLPLTTLRLQTHSGCSNAAPFNAPIAPFPSVPSAGAPAAIDSSASHIHDTLVDRSFRISPTAFYQVNSAAACVLYKVASEWAQPKDNTLLFDVCCGTGTIGITLARSAAKVIGIDDIASAVEDAKANAVFNQLTNCEFVCGKAERVLGSLLQQHAGSYADVVAIVDPPRPGLHKDVLKALLACSQLKRLVYVSCNPDSLRDNAVFLCNAPGVNDAQTGARYQGRGGGRGRGRGGGGGAPASAADAVDYTPFRPVKAVAVDMFPHTPHVEMVMLLTRD